MHIRDLTDRITALTEAPEPARAPRSMYIVETGDHLTLLDPFRPSSHEEALEQMRGRLASAPAITVLFQSARLCDSRSEELLSWLRGVNRNVQVVAGWSPVACLAGAHTLYGAADREEAAERIGLDLISLDDVEPGALAAYDSSTGALFTGAVLGAVGPGALSSEPGSLLASVAAYHGVASNNLVLEQLDRAVSEAGVDPDTVSWLLSSKGAPLSGSVRHWQNTLRDAFQDSDRDVAALGIYLSALLGEDEGARLIALAERREPALVDVDRAMALFEQLGETRAARVLQLISPGEKGSARQPVGKLVPAAPATPTTPAAPATPAEPAALASTVEPDVSSGIGAEGLPTDGRDPVTGLPGPDAFRAGLSRRMSDPGAPAAILVIAVDNIRRINTNYGRSGGDQALHAVSYIVRNFRLSQSSQKAARVYKYEGPQLAYIIPNEDVDRGREVAEEIRHEVSQSTLFLEALTVSIGVVSTTEVAGETPDDRLTRLERAAATRVRVAQQSGQNTVCYTDPEGIGALEGGASVLFADPDAPYLEILSRLLGEEGYSVITAADGQEALDVISQIRPDAIVTEVLLPKLNAFALRNELRHSAELTDIPFIVISHRKDDELIQKALRLGINHYLKKPFSMVELVGLLRNLTGGSGL